MVTIAHLSHQYRRLLKHSTSNTFFPDPNTLSHSSGHYHSHQPRPVQIHGHIISTVCIGFFLNYFPTVPFQNEACKENSTQLIDIVGKCYNAAGNVMPNFLAVNFYMKSDGGGVF